ncbi:MAG: UMP kinase [Gammaproteobacteria bacterium]|nr:UMP kinase [Gammaproteobacteria bacterium]
MSERAPRYRRILLKLSGEALVGSEGFGIDPQVLDRTAAEIAELVRARVEVALVVGGGNLFRGAALSAVGLDRVTGDHMGMLATMMNALALNDAMQRAQLRSRVFSPIPMPGIIEPFDRHAAIDALSRLEVVIFGGGTGIPLFTTDSAACLRGIEIGADVVLKGTKVDGVYSADPEVDPTAEFIPQLTYDEVLRRGLGVMDHTAICLCRDHDMPLRVFNMGRAGVLLRLVLGDEEAGTLITA